MQSPSVARRQLAGTLVTSPASFTVMSVRAPAGAPPRTTAPRPAPTVAPTSTSPVMKRPNFAIRCSSSLRSALPGISSSKPPAAGRDVSALREWFPSDAYRFDRQRGVTSRPGKVPGMAGTVTVPSAPAIVRSELETWLRSPSSVTSDRVCWVFGRVPGRPRRTWSRRSRPTASMPSASSSGLRKPLSRLSSALRGRDSGAGDLTAQGAADLGQGDARATCSNLKPDHGPADQLQPRAGLDRGRGSARVCSGACRRAGFREFRQTDPAHGPGAIGRPEAGRVRLLLTQHPQTASIFLTRACHGCIAPRTKRTFRGRLVTASPWAHVTTACPWGRPALGRPKPAQCQGSSH